MDRSLRFVGFPYLTLCIFRFLEERKKRLKTRRLAGGFDSTIAGKPIEQLPATVCDGATARDGDE
jgi:hypothetical protein